MSRLGLVVPAVLGALSVLQTGLNRRIAEKVGLGVATLVNAVVVLLLASLLLLVVRWAPGVVPAFEARWGNPLGIPRLWWLVPGAIGLMIVAGLPWAVQRVGALPTFVALVAAQMLASMGWDAWVDGVGVSPLRVLGTCLAILGAILAAWA